MKQIQVYPIEREAIPEIAMLLHEYVTGRHYSAPDDAERERWIKGTEKLLGVLVDAENVGLTS
jgi:hypothetical protein